MAYEKEEIKIEKEEIKVSLLKCSICDKEFDRFSSLEVHLLAFHQIFFKGENVIFFWIMCNYERSVFNSVLKSRVNNHNFFLKN